MVLALRAGGVSSWSCIALRGLGQRLSGKTSSMLASFSSEAGRVNSKKESKSEASTSSTSEAGGGHNQGVVTKEYLDQVRWRIFGTYVGNGLRSGRKVLRKNLIGEKVVSWYPQTGPYAKIHKEDQLWKDPDVQEQKERLERYKKRGKGPPKKGEGKRASRK
jgi:small subunit ribosomal protein S33